MRRQHADIQRQQTCHPPADGRDQFLVGTDPVARRRDERHGPFGQIDQHRQQAVAQGDLRAFHNRAQPGKCAACIVAHLGCHARRGPGLAQAFDIGLQRAARRLAHKDIRSARRFHPEDHGVYFRACGVAHPVHGGVHLGQDFRQRAHVAVGIGDRHAQIFQRTAGFGRGRGKARQDRTQCGAALLAFQGVVA
ncbi:hypothetical protein ROE7235_03907 [Roseibaca ekhonensis]|uniref:Uncharacterized protein n=1 Tax=Roseinatronobacter ekhonensis TaxID=254356 RepID=A0A3B0ME08_9RHOB|nr:hypothetical protein ROE7235_03907 [Roseibaca ekhonensis]